MTRPSGSSSRDLTLTAPFNRTIGTPRQRRGYVIFVSLPAINLVPVPSPCLRAKYYFRYVGSTPEPPCFEGVHWRVLKDPIKVAPSQLRSLEKLLYNRIDPVTCQRYTAGTRRFPNRDPERLAYNRPLQTVTDEHKLMYCECADFKSRAENDLAYCNLTMAERGVFNFTNSSNGTRT